MTKSWRKGNPRSRRVSPPTSPIHVCRQAACRCSSWVVAAAAAGRQNGRQYPTEQAGSNGRPIHRADPPILESEINVPPSPRS